MQKHTKFSLLSSLLFSIFIATSSLHPEIIEIKSIAETAYLIDDSKENERPLMIYDLDNTLVEPENEDASDQWFSAMLKAGKQRKRLTSDEVSEIVIKEYLLRQFKTTLRTIEKTTPKVIQRFLKADRVAVIGLTSRSLPIMQHTIQQLKQIGITFTDGVPAGALPSEKLKHAISFTHGIFFCGNNDKGAIMRMFLDGMKKVNALPTQIIFADDKEYHLESVETVADDFEIPFIGCRYGRLDEKVKKFKLKKADRALFNA